MRGYRSPFRVSVPPNPQGKTQKQEGGRLWNGDSVNELKMLYEGNLKPDWQYLSSVNQVTAPSTSAVRYSGDALMTLTKGGGISG